MAQRKPRLYAESAVIIAQMSDSELADYATRVHRAMARAYTAYSNSGEDGTGQRFATWREWSAANRAAQAERNARKDAARAELSRQAEVERTRPYVSESCCASRGNEELSCVKCGRCQCETTLTLHSDSECDGYTCPECEVEHYTNLPPTYCRVEYNAYTREYERDAGPYRTCDGTCPDALASHNAYQDAVKRPHVSACDCTAERRSAYWGACHCGALYERSISEAEELAAPAPTHRATFPFGVGDHAVWTNSSLPDTTPELVTVCAVENGVVMVQTARGVQSTGPCELSSVPANYENAWKCGQLRVWIQSQYELTADGERIASPGKFEGCPVWAIAVYEMMMRGYADSTVYAGDYTPEIDLFRITPSDGLHDLGVRKETECIAAYEDDYGFFYVQEWDSFGNALEQYERGASVEAPEPEPEHCTACGVEVERWEYCSGTGYCARCYYDHTAPAEGCASMPSDALGCAPGDATFRAEYSDLAWDNAVMVLSGGVQ